MGPRARDWGELDSMVAMLPENPMPWSFTPQMVKQELKKQGTDVLQLRIFTKKYFIFFTKFHFLIYKKNFFFAKFYSLGTVFL